MRRFFVLALRGKPGGNHQTNYGGVKGSRRMGCATAEETELSPLTVFLTTVLPGVVTGRGVVDPGEDHAFQPQGTGLSTPHWGNGCLILLYFALCFVPLCYVCAELP